MRTVDSFIHERVYVCKINSYMREHMYEKCHVWSIVLMVWT